MVKMKKSYGTLSDFFLGAGGGNGDGMPGFSQTERE
jgi:hypothetical protein